MKHDLKTDPEEFKALSEGRRSFEIRFDDRGFKVGDQLHLLETKFSGEEMKAGKPLIYTGDEEWMKVRYIFRGPAYGLEEGWVILLETKFSGENVMSEELEIYSAWMEKEDGK